MHTHIYTYYIYIHIHIYIYICIYICICICIQVRLWDVARNADEVKLLMNDVSVGTTANLVGQAASNRRQWRLSP